MLTWQVMEIPIESSQAEISAVLAKGWEPFAVCDHMMYLKRRVIRR
jgi:hypothetical protein